MGRLRCMVRCVGPTGRYGGCISSCGSCCRQWPSATMLHCSSVLGALYRGLSRWGEVLLGYGLIVSRQRLRCCTPGHLPPVGLLALIPSLCWVGGEPSQSALILLMNLVAFVYVTVLLRPWGIVSILPCKSLHATGSRVICLNTPPYYCFWCGRRYDSVFSSYNSLTGSSKWLTLRTDR